VNFIEDTDIAWAAGFFDGEGCVEAYFTVNKHRKAKQLSTSLKAHNTDIRPLLRLQEIFGGVVRTERQAKGTRVAIWVWKISGKQATDVALAMMPYATVKFEQLVYFIKLRELIGMPAEGKSYSADVIGQRQDLVERIRTSKRLP
jgi:hypothetical protein